MINIKINLDKDKIKELTKVLRGQQSVFLSFFAAGVSCKSELLGGINNRKKIEAIFRWRICKEMLCSDC